MKFVVRLLSAIALGAALITTAIAGEGTVVSSINTDMYTYVEVSQNGKNVWVAGPLVAVKPGNVVQFPDGAMMSNFYSKQLQRTFPAVMFVQSIAISAEK